MRPSILSKSLRLNVTTEKPREMAVAAKPSPAESKHSCQELLPCHIRGCQRLLGDSFPHIIGESLVLEGGNPFYEGLEVTECLLHYALIMRRYVGYRFLAPDDDILSIPLNYF
jgi:hypothetical protein